MVDMTGAVNCAFDGTATYLEHELSKWEQESPHGKWDEEYSEQAAFDFLDRLLCAGPMRIDEERRARFAQIAERAERFFGE